MEVVATQNLGKRYGKRLAVDGLEIHLSEGTVFGFLGPNGSGKTTTIRVLLGFLRPSFGRSSIFGLDCWNKSAEIKEEVGYLPGDLRLYGSLTTRSALQLFGKIRGRDLMQADCDLAEHFGLEPDLRVSKMSRGTRQKLGLVLALAHRPRLAILDEPTASLDPVIQKKLKRHLREMAGLGHTVFFSSHTLSEVEQICDRVAILREGRVVTEASLEELRGRADREAHIIWSGGSQPDWRQLPEGVKLLEHNERWWRCELKGSSAALVRWLADKDLDDLTISPPNLDKLFQRYYQS